MLSEIKERATGWIAWTIVIIISIPFAFWGVNEYLSAQSEINVAEVAGQEISQEAYRQNLQQVRERFRRSGFQSDYLDSKEFKRGVVESMVTRALLEIDAEEQGYRISDAQLSEFIRTVPQFQRDGKFDQDAYQRALIASGQSTAGFEARMRRENILAQIRNGFSESVFITPSERILLMRLYAQEREFDYAVLAPDRFAGSVEVSEADIGKHFKENRDSYQTPEQIKVRYLKLAVEDFAKDVTVSDEQVDAFYTQNKNRYQTPEARSASHILIKLSKSRTKEEQWAAAKKAQELAEQARAGDDFAELAKSNSNDSVSAEQGGDLGVVKRGQMVEPFEDALFALAKEGDVSDPVLSDFGYHVIKLNNIIPAQPKPLAEVKAKIVDELRRTQAEEQFIDKAEPFSNLVYEQSRSLEPAAETLGLKIHTSDWFTREQGTGVAASPKVREAAFSDELLVEDRNSDAIEVDGNTLVSIRKFEYKPARTQDLAEVRDQIETTLRQEKARVRAEQIGMELLSRLRSGETWGAVLAEQDLKSESLSHRRSDAVANPPAQVIEAVFQLPRPATDISSYGGLTVSGGGYYLLRLNTVTDSDIAKIADDTKRTVDALLRSHRGNEYYFNYEAGLRKRAEANNEIKVFDENL